MTRHINVWPKNEEVEQRQTSVKLICKRVWFCSSHDEDAFFEWLEKLECVEDFRGSRETLYIFLPSVALQDDTLREFIALFERYQIDKKQLAIFLHEKNKSWFADPEMYWYQEIFGSN